MCTLHKKSYIFLYKTHKDQGAPLCMRARTCTRICARVCMHTEDGQRARQRAKRQKKGNRSDTTIYCIVRHIKHHYILYGFYLHFKAHSSRFKITLILYCPRNFARFAVFHMVDFFPYLTMSNPGGPVPIFDMFFHR